ncbi:hypothetical protein BDV96DRAFT_665879 [Lophiotrema nucula]|uniref:Uncharacterized protein n=1 Tax=Lophiotrema nucula TaxID=690887 RepID=A0A6A5YWN7_9PLEO|nr:hypothetical protein BDV96DRAFT_665879 [Lophiotrema nucula]
MVCWLARQLDLGVDDIQWVQEFPRHKFQISGHRNSAATALRSATNIPYRRFGASTPLDLKYLEKLIVGETFPTVESSYLENLRSLPGWEAVLACYYCHRDSIPNLVELESDSIHPKFAERNSKLPQVPLKLGPMNRYALIDVETITWVGYVRLGSFVSTELASYYQDQSRQYLLFASCWRLIGTRSLQHQHPPDIHPSRPFRKSLSPQVYAPRKRRPDSFPNSRLDSKNCHQNTK